MESKEVVDWKMYKHVIYISKNVGLWPLYNMNTIYYTKNTKMGSIKEWKIIQVREKMGDWFFPI